jgi:ribonuclease BN (tRNA processing enzyme)
MKTAALGAVTASATATGLIGSLNNAQAAPPAGPPKKGGQAGPPGPPPSFKHEQEFSVITLGTGNPIPDANRASSGTAVQYKGKYYIMDTGNGVNNVMAENGYAFSDIRAIMFTHLHADHTTDFIDIMINRWMTGGKELEILGPPRSGGFYKFMTEFFADDLIYRKYRGIKMGVTDVGMLSGVNVTEYTGSNTFKLDGMKVQTAEMIHTQYDLAYRFDVDGKSIVVSGDTSYTKELSKLAKDADILVIDTNLSSAPTSKQSVEGEAFTDKSIVKPKPIYEFSGNFEVAPHMGIAEVAKTAAEANVKKVVMTHLSPAPVNLEAAKKYFKEAGFKGEVIEAKDGLEINP